MIFFPKAFFIAITSLCPATKSLGSRKAYLLNLNAKNTPMIQTAINPRYKYISVKGILSFPSIALMLKVSVMLLSLKLNLTRRLYSPSSVPNLTKSSRTKVLAGSQELVWRYIYF